MIENKSDNNSPTEQHKKYFTAQARRAHVRAYSFSLLSSRATCLMADLFVKLNISAIPRPVR